MSFKQILANFAKKLTTIAQKVPQVYEAGKQAAYKEEWDERQQNGNRTGYVYGYAGNTWNDKTFDPLHSMYVSDALGMFTQSRIGDLDGIIKRKGIVMDFSNSNRFTNMFGYSTVKYAGHIDTQKASSLGQMFESCYYLVSVSLGLNPAGTQTFSNTFRACTALEELDLTGCIGKDGFDVSSCTKLNKASHLNIFAVISTTVSITVIFSKVAVNKAFETAPGANDGSTSQEWNDLVDTRPNATIVLA